jgi:hypothetical protein
MAGKKRGPSPIRINWAEFDKLASYQCSQLEIADWFGIDVSTLENACERDFGVKLSVLWDKKKGLMRTRLKKIQWSLAEQGSTAMAIFLGKHLLGQTDAPIDVEILNAVQKAGLSKDQAVNLILEAGQSAQKQGKKSFEDFCEAAGYPRPFAKQIEMMKFGIEETEPRLLLGARGYGKTDYVVILGTAFDLYVNPLTSTTLIMSKSKERNAAMIKEIENACLKNGVFFEKATSSCLRVTGLHGKDHSVSAVTIKTVSLRGRHPKRVILDDPVTEDDTSEATRLLVEKKWNEVNKLVSNVLIIGQPAHRYDLYAKLRPLLKKMEVVHGSIPELDHDLEAQRLAGVDEASIQASYFLNILSEGSTPFDSVKYLDKFPIGDSAVAFVDPSHEGGDFTALTIVRSHFQGIAVVGFVWKKAWNHCLDEIVQKLSTYHVKKLAFETNALGDQPVIMLRQAFGGGVVGRRTVTNKHSRIMAAGAYAHLIHLSKESSPQYIDQVIQYEYKSKHDDAPDSLASALEWIGLIRGKGN